MALASVLAAHNGTPAALEALLDADEATQRTFWSMTAELATAAEGRTIHPPNSEATVRVVMVFLGDMLAAEADRKAAAAQRDAEEAYPTFVAPALDDDPEPWLDDDDSAEYRSRKLAEPIAPPSEIVPDKPWDGGRHSRVMGEIASDLRSPRDSAGYRTTMAAIAPQPETTEADLFAPFAQAAR
jgi:hypothetical protein